MATSYANTGGQGDRTALITVASNATSFQGTPPNLVNGATGNNSSASWVWNSGQSGRVITFDFSAIGHVLIDEAKWKTDGGENNGQWKWDGSDDGSSWTELTATDFLLQGTSGGVVLGNLSANTTPYFFYRLRQVSGTTSTFSFMFEIEFKIDTILSSITGVLAATDIIDVAAFTSATTITGSLASTDAQDFAIFAESGYMAILIATDAQDVAELVGRAIKRPNPVVVILNN